MGAIGENRVLRASGEQVELKGNDECALEAGDVYEMLTPGGGGFGK